MLLFLFRLAIITASKDINRKVDIMSNIERFDAVRESIINGQHKQSAEQMASLNGCQLGEMMDYFTLEIYDCKTAVRAAKNYFLLN
jgi:hypothetical protein